MNKERQAIASKYLARRVEAEKNLQLSLDQQVKKKQEKEKDRILFGGYAYTIDDKDLESKNSQSVLKKANEQNLQPKYDDFLNRVFHKVGNQAFQRRQKQDARIKLIEENFREAFNGQEQQLLQQKIDEAAMRRTLQVAQEQDMRSERRKQMAQEARNYQLKQILEKQNK